MFEPEESILDISSPDYDLSLDFDSDPEPEPIDSSQYLVKLSRTKPISEYLAEHNVLVSIEDSHFVVRKLSKKLFYNDEYS